MPPAKTKSAKTAQIHVLTGSDEAEIKRAASALVERLAPGDDPFGKEVIDGAVSTVDESVNRIEDTIGALLTLPFFGGGKLVWLKSASFLADSPQGRSDAVLAALEKLLGVLADGLPEGVHFVISAPGADKRRTAYKNLTKLGEVHLFEKPDTARMSEDELLDWVGGRAADAGLKISAQALAGLAARVGSDSGQMHNELEKLSLCIGPGREIGMDDIRMLVPMTREGGIFDLSNAIALRDLRLALATLNQLLDQGESAIGILLAAIVPQVRNLLIAKDLLVTHRLQPPAEAHFFARMISRIPEEETTHLPRKKDGGINTYGLGLAAMHCSRFTLDELREALIQCAHTNRTLISGTLPDDIALSQLIIRLLAHARNT